MAYLEQVAFADLCDDMQSSATEQDLQTALTRFVRRNGYEWFAYISKSPTEAVGSSSYPVEWQRQYVDQNYVRIDPVLLAAQREPLPTKWKGAEYTANKWQKHFFSAAADFNIRNGVVIPIAGVYGSFVSLSLAGHHNDNIAADALENQQLLTLAALHYHMQASRMREKLRQAEATGRIQLTQRSRTCLTWIARGKTIQETASILNVHEATVRFHLNEARKRLQAVSLPHLVAEALSKGEISY